MNDLERKETAYFLMDLSHALSAHGIKPPDIPAWAQRELGVGPRIMWERVGEPIAGLEGDDGG